MTRNGWIRQTHRWLSLAFTLAVLANIATNLAGTASVWVGVLALVPLIPLMLTGLWLFAQPWLARRDGTAAATREARP
ncbi:hypothetical protein [Stappia sp. TSB10P1A]|uniref:hypothetical protein n=1 Tax=Stappia sp. TSB10P1A TaxID=2003585 RepID=UPI001643F780|nr:hypothetical protein [Stappia sp. TSB10P1A]